MVRNMLYTKQLASFRLDDGSYIQLLCKILRHDTDQPPAELTIVMFCNGEVIDKIDFKFDYHYLLTGDGREAPQGESKQETLDL